MVQEVNTMTAKSISDAQEFLVIDYGGRRKRILDITTLLQNHTEDAVIRFLKSLLKEKQKVMRQYLVKDKTSPCLDEAVSESFRIGMAITVLESESEVTINHEIEQGAGASGEFSHGSGRSHCSSR
jgi:hypothetical protein